MSGERSDAARNSSERLPSRTPGSNRSKEYYWDFEYYDYEPISFEGLRAHRYSIVIGFWVGIASFVLFMFFILVMLVRSGTTDSRGASARRRAHALPRGLKPGDMSSVVDPGFGDGRDDEDAEVATPMTRVHCELRPSRTALLHAEREGSAAANAADAADASVLYHSDSFDIPNLISESHADAGSGTADVRPSLSD